LLNDDLKKYDLYITPWLGIGLVILVLYPLSLLGFPAKQVTIYFFAAVLLLNVAVFLKYKETAIFAKSDLILIIILGFTVATIYGSVLAARGFEYYGVALNSDFGVYLDVAKTFMESSAKSLLSAPAGVPGLTLLKFTVYHQLRGCILLLPFFASLFNLEMPQMFYSLLAFCLFLTIINFRLFLKDAKRLLAACLVLGILCFNTFYQWLVFWCFWGQLLSIGLVLLIFYVTFYLSVTDRLDYRTDMLLVFLLTVNNVSYIESLAYPLIPILAFALFSCFRGGAGKYFLKNSMLVVFSYSALNIAIIIEFFRLFFLLSSNNVAWNMHMATLFDVTGLFGAFAGSTNNIVIIAVNCALLFVLARQFEKERFSSFLSVTSGAFFALYIFFCFLYFRDGSESTYKAYKSAVSLSFVVIIVFLRFAEERLNVFFDALRVSFAGDFAKRRLGEFPWKKSAWALVFFCFFSLNVTATYSYYLKPLITYGLSGVGDRHDILRAFVESPQYADADFILDVSDSLALALALYHMPRGRSYAFNYKAYPSRNMKNSFRPGDIYVTDGENRNIYDINADLLFKNDVYRVYALEKESLLMYDFSGLALDVNIIRPSGKIVNIRKLLGNEANFEFISLPERVVDFHVTFYNASEPPALIVAKAYLNEKLVRTFAIRGDNTSIALGGISLREGRNRISFVFDGDISKMSVADLNFSEEAIDGGQH
jgi:hypothetical protein